GRVGGGGGGGGGGYGGGWRGGGGGLRLECGGAGRCWRTWRRNCGGLLFGADGIEDISRFGDVGKINLGPDFVLIRAGGAGGSGLSMRLAAAAKVLPHLLRFVLFDRAGMRFLLGSTHHRQRIENGLALDFQLSGQIVNSNLGHPPFLSLNARSS